MKHVKKLHESFAEDIAHMTTEEMKQCGWEVWNDGPSAEGCSYVKKGYGCQVIDGEHSVYKMNTNLKTDPNIVIWSSITGNFQDNRIFLGNVNTVEELQILEEFLRIEPERYAHKHRGKLSGKKFNF